MSRVKICVMLKEGVFDPQGEVIQRSLWSLSFKGVKRVRQGKVFEVILSTDDKSEAEREVHAMCQKLLVNPVIERFEYTIETP